MTSRIRCLLAVPTICLGLLGAACTGGEGNGTGPEPTASEPPASESPIPSGPVRWVPGEFHLDLADVQATLRWESGAGVLEVLNGSQDPIGAPSLYALTQDQRKVDAEIPEGGEIPAGGSDSFEVSFPENLSLPDVGLLVIGFGDISYGLLSPVPVED